MPSWHKLDTPPTIFCIAHCGDGRWLVGTNDGLFLITGDTATRTAPSLQGVAISALAAAPPHILVGAADGIAYSHDFGESWTYASVPDASQVAQIALSPNFAQDGVAFAATLGHGVWRTTDGGHTWTERNFGLIGREAIALTLSPGFPMDVTLVAAMEDGLFLSQTAGETWQLLPLEPAAHPVAALAFLPRALIVGSEQHGLYFSTNRGFRWSRRRDFAGGPIAALATSPTHRRAAVARPDGLVAVSEDDGESWMRLPRRAPAGILALALDDDGALLCGTQTQGLWRYA